MRIKKKIVSVLKEKKEVALRETDVSRATRVKSNCDDKEKIISLDYDLVKFNT